MGFRETGHVLAEGNAAYAERQDVPELRKNALMRRLRIRANAGGVYKYRFYIWLQGW